MTEPAPSGLRTFGLLWTVQVASLLGSEVTRFGLGLWLLARSGAVADFAWVLLCETVPYVLLSPLGGALTDRYDRRLVLALSDLASTLALVPIAVAAWLGVAEPWLVYAGVAFSAATNAAQSPAFVASVAQVVPPAQISRATGLTNVGRALAHIVAPAIAAPLATLGPGAVISIEVATTVLALTTLAFLRLPRVSASAQGPGLWAGIAEAFAFLRARLDLRALITALAILNLALAFADALLPPMLLRRGASPVSLGLAASVVAAGGVCGAGLMILWHRPPKPARGLLVFGLGFSLCLSLVGLWPAFPAAVALGFLFAFCVAPIESFSHTVWQAEVPAGLQGRVFAVRNMAAAASAPVAYFLAGPLTDGYFEGALAQEGGPWPSFLARGPGGGIATFLLLLGLGTAAMTVWAALRLERKGKPALAPRVPDELPAP